MDDFSNSVLTHHVMSTSKARRPDHGWKLNPAARISEGEVFILGEIERPITIQSRFCGRIIR